MQPSYAQDLGVSGIEHGIYGSFINALGLCLGACGAIPCCPVSIMGRVLETLGYRANGRVIVPESIQEGRAGIRRPHLAIRSILQGQSYSASVPQT